MRTWLSRAMLTMMCSAAAACGNDTTGPGLRDEIEDPIFLRVTPRDTPIALGRSIELRGGAVNAEGDTGAVSIRALDPSVAQVDGLRITASSPGRARFEVAAGSLVDTIRFSVVPHGTLAAVGGFGSEGRRGVHVFSTDLGTSRTWWGAGADNWVFAPWRTGTTTWMPDGSAVIAEVADILWRIGESGGGAELLRTPWPGEISQTVDPAVSAQDDAVIFAGFSSYYNNATIWRLAPGSTVPTQVAPAPTSSATYMYGPHARATDGLIVFSLQNRETDLQTFEPATDELTSLGVSGRGPRWSPSGESIAFLADDGELRLLDVASGSVRSIVTDGTRYVARIDWSPDGRFLVLVRLENTRDTRDIEIIDVDQGVRMPLVGTTGLEGPAWRPR